MAGRGMRDIKRRIKSVNSTKQITKAMELVSSAKLKKARDILEKSRPYFNTIDKTIQEMIASSKGIQHEFLKPREVKKTAYIVVTADRGLCGGYNSNVIKAALSHMEEKKAVSVIAVGQKGRDFFRKRNYDLDGEFIHILEKPSFADAANIGRLTIELYKQQLVDEVYLIFTKFVSTINHKPTVIKLLPLEANADAALAEREEFMTYEPSPEAVLNYLIPKYIHSMIYGALVESSTSEQGARRVAMENATDNAEDMIEDLQLKFNRARQASITQEIAEIVGGANALK